jgi:hypothetical protein
MMKKYLYGAVLSSLLLMTGCVTTPTKPQTFDQLGKFSTTPLNQNMYRVSFQAPLRMDWGTAEEIALVKSAQITLQNGFQFFKVLNDPSNRMTQAPRQAVVYSAPTYYPGFYRRYPGYWPDPFYSSREVVDIDPIQVIYSIECYKANAAPQEAFDARLILQSLGAKYGLSPTGQVLPALTPSPSS